MLSAGWTPSLVAIFAGAWAAACGLFVFGANAPLTTKALDVAFGRVSGGSRYGFFAGSLPLVCSLLPLMVASDIAFVSDACDKLMDTLNNLRASHGLATRPEHPVSNRVAVDEDIPITISHDQLKELELHLKGLHRGKGLGIVLGETLIDKRFIKATLLDLCTDCWQLSSQS